MLWCAITPERREKTLKIVGSLGLGWLDGGAKIVDTHPPDDEHPFAVWGQLFTAIDIIPPALASHRPFLHIDNGYWKPAGGRQVGYYRITYRGLAPVLLRNPPIERASIADSTMGAWRKTGRHIVFAHPGLGYGKAVGLNMPDWIAQTDTELRQVTDRPILVRPKECGRRLHDDLRDAWALVTHSSNVAIDAVRAGIPVFVAASSPAAPVGNVDLADIEAPRMPARAAWWTSLLSQQFTLPEMADGTAYRFLKMVMDQVDGEC